MSTTLPLLRELFPPEIRKIGICAPSSPSPRESFMASCHSFREAGLDLSLADHILSGAEESYFSAENEERLSDLNTLIEDDTIPLILASRGGYGSAWLLEEFNYGALRKEKKILCGYSDITALHLAMIKYDAGLCVASPMFTGLEEKLSDPAAFQSMKRALARAWELRKDLPGSPMKYFTKLTGVFTPPEEMGQPVKGKVAALNLTLFSRLCGTKFLPDFRDWLLIIEEVGEPPRKIDFSFLQLHLSGALKGCRGIIMGDYTDCGNEEELDKIFRRIGKQTNIPIWKGFPFGHGVNTSSLVWGEMIEIDCDGKCFLSGAEEWI